MEGNKGPFNSGPVKFGKKFLCEMEPRRRRGGGTMFLRVNRLVPFSVFV